MPPISIDGTDITGATIDGQEVEEITVDGQTVFSGGGVSTFNEIGIFSSSDEGPGTSIGNNSTINIGSGFSGRTIYIAAVQLRTSNTSEPELDNNTMVEEVRSNVSNDAWAAIYSFNDNGSLGSNVVFDYKSMSNGAFRFFSADAGVSATSTGGNLTGESGGAQLYAYCEENKESTFVKNANDPADFGNIIKANIQPLGNGVNDHGDGGVWGYNFPSTGDVTVETNLGNGEESAVAAQIF